MEYTKSKKSDLDYIVILIVIMYWIMPLYHYLIGL
jgi:hypothetical protein